MPLTRLLSIYRAATRANAWGATSIQQPSRQRQGKLKDVLAIMLYHRHHQVAVFRGRIERAKVANECLEPATKAALFGKRTLWSRGRRKPTTERIPKGLCPFDFLP